MTFQIRMKTIKIISIALLLSLVIPLFGQENNVILHRTPEQEAIKQTEKLQQELNLTNEQAKQVYEINLRYARERQISNKRSEAVERMKNKNTEIQQVLNQEQNEKLQTKRYERTSIESPTIIRNQPVNPSSFRSNSDFRTNQTVRIPSSNRNVRSDFVPSTPTGTQVPQSVRRNPTTQQQNSPSRTNPTINRPTPTSTNPWSNRPTAPTSPPPRRVENINNSSRR